MKRLCVSLYISLLACAGCGDDYEEPDAGRPYDCESLAAVDVQGLWRLEGEGTRYDCEEPRLDGDLSISAVAFGVKATAVATDDPSPGDLGDSEADAFVERIKRSDFTLEKSSDRNAELEFTGSANLCEVSFSLREQLGGRDELAYDFEGYIYDQWTIRGRFRGRGPDRCRSTGDFTVNIR